MDSFTQTARFIRKLFHTPEDFIPLHAPVFIGNEKEYLLHCIESTFVSSVGEYVTKFENDVRDFTGSKFAVAVVNGTSALHIALLLSDVKSGDEVITQSLTFIATANAISYTGAYPIFLDVDIETMGLSPNSLLFYLENNVKMVDGVCINKNTGRRIKACVPMHTFGTPCRIDEIVSICEKFNIDVIEDSAESLGSYYKNQHTGTFGKFGILSFNGNKIVTTGGGGMILTNDSKLASLAKHITTTAKLPHKWEFIHDMIGYNYRLTNLAAALGCAQMEQLENFLIRKRNLASEYSVFFRNAGIRYFNQPKDCFSNCWLNAIILNDIDERNRFLEYMNENKIMVRPAWELMHKLVMYKNCERGILQNTDYLADRVVNIPSSAIFG